MVEGGDLWDEFLCLDDVGLLYHGSGTSLLEQDVLGAAIDIIDSPPRKLKRRRFNVAKEELTALRQTLVDLTRQLEALTESRSKVSAPSHHISIWAAAARHERVEARRASDENAALRSAVEERAASIEHLRRIVFKKTSQLTDHPITNDLWRTYHLPAATGRRLAAIHAIADLQRRRHVEIFMQAGVLAQDDDLYQAKPITLPDFRPGLQVINHVNLPIPYHTATSACWESLAGSWRPSSRSRAQETLEHIDDDTVYDRFTDHLQAEPQLDTTDVPTAVSNTIRKRFHGPDKDVVICRTVLVDAAHPVDDSGAAPNLVDDMAGWIVTRPHPDAPATSCRFTSLFQVPLEAHGVQNAPRTRYDMDAILAVIKNMSFVSTPTAASPTMHIDTQSMDLTTISTPIPSMGTFLGRGKAFEQAIKASLNAAIAALLPAPSASQPAATTARRPVEAVV
ncbi:hypothetical protein H310_04228 [Aphanomyces invadans]|uniref:START domain-containing protein n=1 Tax=Aphanomyces invadans TaxID=157072 RepID=A0A024UG58_9STRA|nr:hypothetical protein H310_04228 [Aphanomyces invadans]ETW05264.1 hypothetical protein H310_04228 [Aphanomyces invadans]|eukprot:XP_008866702.1 hypothetical protein H310_04228 [Aphanomyces invadans]